MVTIKHVVAQMPLLFLYYDDDDDDEGNIIIINMQHSNKNNQLLPPFIRCSERRLIGHSFHRRNLLRKSFATCREKCRRAAPRTDKFDKPAQ
jgi:hypothetical protein